MLSQTPVVLWLVTCKVMICSDRYALKQVYTGRIVRYFLEIGYKCPNRRLISEKKPTRPKHHARTPLPEPVHGRVVVVVESPMRRRRWVSPPIGLRHRSQRGGLSLHWFLLRRVCLHPDRATVPAGTQSHLGQCADFDLV